jgi:hypothetical protein
VEPRKEEEEEEEDSSHRELFSERSVDFLGHHSFVIRQFLLQD